MNSLILKDFISLKSYSKTLAIIIGFFTIITFTNDEPSFLSGMIILIMSMLPITSFSYDQHAKWDLFSQTLPVSRKQLVMSKYVLGIISIIAGAILAILLNVVVLLVKSLEVDVWYLFLANSLIALVALLYLSILIPLVYKFGVEKSRLLMIVVLAIPSVLAIGLSKAGVSIPVLDEITPAILVAIGLVFVVCVMLISYVISVRIYMKKDF